MKSVMPTMVYVTYVGRTIYLVKNHRYGGIYKTKLETVNNRTSIKKMVSIYERMYDAPYQVVGYQTV